MLFNSTVRLSGKTATGIPVPVEIIEKLGAGKRPALKVTIGSYTYRTTVGSVDGEYMLPLSAENRTAAGLSAGDEIAVEVEVDTAPREVTVPDDLAQLLDSDLEAKQAFEKLSYSNKLAHVLSIEQAKTPETRQRRLEKTLTTLRESSK